MSKKKLIIIVISITCAIIALIYILSPRSTYNTISVTESKWNSFMEARTLNTNLVLEEINFNDYKLMIDGNTLYYSLIKDSKYSFNPKVSYVANRENVKLAILKDEITIEKVNNDYQFKVMIYDEKEYNTYTLKCTTLSILNINYSEEIGQKDIPMEIYLFDNMAHIPNKITISGGRVKASDSDIFFSLHILTPGKNRRESPKSILNMRPSKEYVLTPINGEVEEEVGMGRQVELFLNNKYKGRYIIESNEKNIREIN